MNTAFISLKIVVGDIRKVRDIDQLNIAFRAIEDAPVGRL